MQAVEITEERIALNTVCQLQRWARDNEVLINFTQLLSSLEDSQNPGKITQNNFLTGILQMGFQEDSENHMNLMILIKLLINYNKDSDYLIDYNRLFEDLLYGA